MITVFTDAQNTVPNGGFENWTSAVYNSPSSFMNNSNFQNFSYYHAPFNVTQSTDAFSGSYAVQIETNTNGVDTCGGFMTNANNTNGNPMTWTGGVPYNDQPTGISGHYKYNVAAGDSAIMILIFKNAGSTIGFYFFKIGGNYSNYQPFNFTLSPALPMAADTVIFAVASSNLMNSHGSIGSTLLLDSVTFTGAATQPAQFNGDFETWQSQSIDSPDNWFTPFNGGTGSLQTADAASGNFALQIETVLGSNQNGVPKANAGFASTGTYVQSCNCMVGGSPFTGVVDTLAFSYKYTPADPTDSANVSLMFKAAGASMGWAGGYLHATNGYQYMEIPIYLFSSPDSVIITAQSSNWADSTVNFVGAVLKLDDMHFKGSSSVGIANFKANSNEVSFYPNPMNQTGNLEINSSISLNDAQLRIVDVLGRTVSTMEVTKHNVVINRNNMVSGIYFYELMNNGKVASTGKIVIQ